MVPSLPLELWAVVFNYLAIDLRYRDLWACLTLRRDLAVSYNAYIGVRACISCQAWIDYRRESPLLPTHPSLGP
jgi:hypothetical protein